VRLRLALLMNSQPLLGATPGCRTEEWAPDDEAGGCSLGKGISKTFFGYDLNSQTADASTSGCFMFRLLDAKRNLLDWQCVCFVLFKGGIVNKYHRHNTCLNNPSIVAGYCF